MLPSNSELLRLVSPAALGARLREARLKAGLRQEQVAGSDVNPSYVSRIEAGQRKPELNVLTVLASRVHVPVDELLTGLTSAQRDDLQARLDLAEFSLSSSTPSSALEAADGLAAELHGLNVPHLARAIRRLRANALEGVGDLDNAAAELAALTAEPTPDTAWVRDLISLSRCLRESGDVDQAIRGGEDREATIERLGLAGTTEAIQLTLTTAAAYIYRGDLGHALRTCKRALAVAEAHDLPLAKASALWNGSLALQIGGEVDRALAMATEALTVFEQVGDTRNLGRLRIHVANIQLSLQPPDAVGALEMLERARDELDWSTASALDASRHRLGIATALEILGHRQEAAEALAESVSLSPGNAMELRASQAALRGRLAVAAGDLESARLHYQEAVTILSGSGADTDAANLWLELGEVLSELGEASAASDAFQRAGAARGLRLIL